MSGVPGTENTFTNNNVGGTAFSAVLNDAGGTLNLDIRGNTAAGGGSNFLIDEVDGTFAVVDRDESIQNNGNNIGGAFDLNGGAVVDFDDLGAGPIDEVD